MTAKENCLCSECGRRAEKNRIFEVDGAHICANCLYDNAVPFEIWPIGVVQNKLRRKKTGFGTVGPRNVSRIELFPSQTRFLYKLEEEKCITIVYYLHQRKPVKSVFKRGLDGKETGVFATRTPDRLSGIGIQDVKLLKIEGTTLYVEGLDAINGTPVLDIKMLWSSVT
ncbi:MAG TPA: TrmO family methyltransferase [Syntrophales bacterium]|nr:TrmO family methyltransferase [Smithellaceae bacterium]HPL64808.1 TrmO family methyltransferase [Syntrophales bacterium]